MTNHDSESTMRTHSVDRDALRQLVESGMTYAEAEAHAVERDAALRGDTAEQVGNRIAMWRDLILNPENDDLGPSLEYLLDCFASDVALLAVASVRTV